MRWGGSTSCTSLGKLREMGEAIGMQVEAAFARWGKCYQIHFSVLSSALPQAIFQVFISTAATQGTVCKCELYEGTASTCTMQSGSRRLECTAGIHVQALDEWTPPGKNHGPGSTVQNMHEGSGCACAISQDTQARIHTRVLGVRASWVRRCGPC